MTKPPFLENPDIVQVVLCSDCSGYGDVVRLTDHYDPYRRQIAKHGIAVEFSPTHALAPFAKGELAADLATAFYSRARKAKTLRAGCSLPPKILVGNCAPREQGTKNAHGCPFVLASLPGLIYMGTAWSELSFVKQHVRSLHVLDVPNSGTQYRSQFLGDALARFLIGDESVIKEELDRDLIPDPDLLTVARVDAMGNINLNLPEDHPIFRGRRHGEKVKIFINGAHQQVIYCGGIGGTGDAKVGDLVLVPGSLSYSIEENGPRNMDIQFVIDSTHRSAAAAGFVASNGVVMRNQVPVGGDKVSLVWARSVEEIIAAARI